MGACCVGQTKPKKRRSERNSLQLEDTQSTLHLKVLGESTPSPNLSPRAPLSSGSISDFRNLTVRAKTTIVGMYNSDEGNISNEHIEELEDEFGIGKLELGSYVQQLSAHDNRKRSYVSSHSEDLILPSISDDAVDQAEPPIAESPTSPVTPHLSFKQMFFPEIYGADDLFSEEVLEGQYKIEMQLGSGAHGTVYMAVTTSKHLKLPEGTAVAIKRIDRIFSQPYKAKCIVREMRAERYFGDHECITKLIDVIIPKPHNLLEFQTILLVFEYMECDLDQHIESLDMTWTEESVKHCMRELLMGVKYLHTGKFAHRDLKPENILVNPLGEIHNFKLADFGLCRCFSKNDKRPSIQSSKFFPPSQDITEIKFNPKVSRRVVTRYYRAPEVSLLMQDRNQLPKIDIWSLGCILGELIQLIPGNDARAKQTGTEILFRGAKDLVLSPKKNQKMKRISKNQLAIIFDFLGKPSNEFIDQIVNEKIRSWVQNQPNSKPENLEQLFPAASTECLDLFRGMLKYDPQERLSAEECLRHPWLATAEENAHELIHEPIIEDYEDVYLNDYELRLMVVDEILHYHSEWKEHLQYRNLTTRVSTARLEIGGSGDSSPQFDVIEQESFVGSEDALQFDLIDRDSFQTTSPFSPPTLNDEPQDSFKL